MLAQLQALATEKSSEKRRELLGKVADLFFSSAPDLRGEAEMASFAEVVTLLLRNMPAPGRAEFAEDYVRQADLPRTVVAMLVEDEIAVATPVIQHSPVLTEADLIDIAQRKTTDHRMAIAGRSHIGMAVTDTLMTFEEPGVMRAIVDNDTARISTSGFKRLTQQAAVDPALGAQLGARQDLPVDVAMQLLPLLPEAVRQKLQYLISADQEGVTGLMRQAVPKVSEANLDRANRRLQIKADAQKFKPDAAMRDVWLNTIVQGGKITEVVLALAELSGLSEPQSTNALVSVELSALAVLCKSLELRAETFVSLNRMRCQRVRLPVQDDAEVRALYEELGEDGARRAMSFVKLRSSVAGS